MKYIQSKSKKKVMNVINMSQYNISGNYVTIFGELHTTIPLLYDKKLGIGLDEFILDRIHKNKSIKILLEYNPDFNPLTIESNNINEIYRKLYDNNLNSHIIPFDYKYYFINYHDYFKLFNSLEFLKLTKNQIIKCYLDPYFDKSKHHAFNLDMVDYTKDAYNYLYEYLKNIENRLGYLYEDINLPKNKKVYKSNDMLRFELIINWANLADFFILREILKKQTSEYIIVVGDNHRINIQKILFNFPKLAETNGELFGIYEPEIKRKS